MNKIIYLILLILSCTGLSVYAYDYTEEDKNSVIDCYTKKCNPYSIYQDPYSIYQDPYSIYQDPYSVYQDPYSENYVPNCKLTGSC
jgi:hypothetical protein